MNSQRDDDSVTHFGYETVLTSEKKHKVAEVFHSVANRYDLMNDLMSIGIHRLWKNTAIHLGGFRKNQFVLDVAGGTGDLTAKISTLVGDQGQIVLSDINASMLQVGRCRLLDKGIFNNIRFIQADAEQLPFTNNYFDRIIIGFGLRNVTNKENALQSMYRILKPGGRLIILEFSKPELSLLKTLYDTYSFQILPFLGKIVANDADSYRYLAESIRMHPDQNTLQHMMENAGFENCDFHNLSGGIVAIHRGYKF
jgi:demethylmenaquinone methyltransferase/2-methoxy-6-polyprenyl-1,4-benzoquinol methylase